MSCPSGVADYRFGLNYTTEKGLHRVTLAQTLDIQNIPREACEVNGMFVATYGTEDARLFWTVSPHSMCSADVRMLARLV